MTRGRHARAGSKLGSLWARLRLLIPLLLVAGLSAAVPDAGLAAASTQGTISTVYSGTVTGVSWAGGKLYVADSALNAIKGIDNNGTSTAKLSMGSTALSPSGVAAADDGTLYFAAGNAVYQRAPNGTVSLLAASYGPGNTPFNFSYGASLALAGRNLYVLGDTAAGASVPIVQIDVGTGAAAAFSASPPVKFCSFCGGGTWGLAATRSAVYVASPDWGEVYEVAGAAASLVTGDPSNNSTAEPVAGALASQTNFDLAWGMAADAAGNLFVGIQPFGGSLTGPQVWEILKSTGRIKLVAGGGSTTAATAPAGTAATAVNLGGLVGSMTVDRFGNLYLVPSALGSSGYHVYEVAGVAASTQSLTVAVGSAGGTVSDASSGIGCAAGASSGCTGWYLTGATATLTATPPAGTVAQWTGCDSTSGNTCTLTMGTDRQVSVSFVPVYGLTVQVMGTGTGAVESAGATSINCPSVQCTEQVSYAGGQPGVVTLNALPAAGSYLSGWNGCDNNAQVTCTVTMSQAKTVTAFFQTCPVSSCSPVTGANTTFSAVCPVAGSTGGGSLVTLSGKDLATTDLVLFDGKPAPVVSGSADHTQLTVKSPAHTQGSATVTIWGLSGDQATFSYQDTSATVSGISPAAALHVLAGPVTVTGSNLFDVTAVTVGTANATNVHAACDGTSVTFTPPDVPITEQSDVVTVHTAAGLATGTVNLARTDPYAQGVSSTVYTPVEQALLPNASTSAAQTFTYTTPDKKGSVTVSVPANALPVGTRLDIYRGDPAKLQANLPAGSTIRNGYAIAWTAPDGTHPVAKTPVTVNVVDPTVSPKATVYAAGSDGVAHALTLSITVPLGVHDVAVLDGPNHFSTLIPVTPGETINGSQVIAAGSGNVIAAGSGNLAFAGGYVIAAGSGNVIAAGSGNVIAAGSGNVIAAGSGNVIAAGSGNFSVLAATGLAMQQLNAVIPAGAGNFGIFSGASLIAGEMNGASSLTMRADPQVLLADPPAAPGAPTGVTAQLSADQAAVSWQPPTVAAGAPAVSSYAVHVYQDGSVGPVIVYPDATTSVLVPGLVAGHHYTFTVAAFNGGYGPESAASAPISLSPPPPGAPTVTGLHPAAGPTAGGTTVMISGSKLSGATAVRFGSNAAPFTVNSATQLSAISPAGSVGSVDVTVTTAGGTSATSAADRFAYTPPPTVTPPADWLAAVTGSDSALWARRTPAGPWTSLGGRLLGAPAVVDLPRAGGPEVPLFLGTGLDHAVWERTPTAGWRRLIPAYCIGAPAGTLVGSTLILACRGADSALWYTEAWAGSAVLPTAKAWHSLGGRLIAPPAVARVAGAVTFFVTGTNRQVFLRTPTTGYRGTVWRCNGHLAVVTSAAGVSTFACQGTDRALWQATDTGSGWSGPSWLGGVLLGGPGMAILPSGVQFVAEGTDRALWTRSATLGWSRLGGVLQHGAAAAGP